MDEMRESEIFADGVFEGEMETMARANDQKLYKEVADELLCCG